MMAGISDNGTSADAAYLVVLTLSVFSIIGAPMIGIVYLGVIYARWRPPGGTHRKAHEPDGHASPDRRD
jgi:hypothetical protein